MDANVGRLPLLVAYISASRVTKLPAEVQHVVLKKLNRYIVPLVWSTSRKISLPITGTSMSHRSLQKNTARITPFGNATDVPSVSTARCVFPF